MRPRSWAIEKPSYPSIGAVPAACEPDSSLPPSGSSVGTAESAPIASTAAPAAMALSSAEVSAGPTSVRTPVAAATGVPPSSVAVAGPALVPVVGVAVSAGAAAAAAFSPAAFFAGAAFFAAGAVVAAAAFFAGADLVAGALAAGPLGRRDTLVGDRPLDAGHLAVGGEDVDGRRDVGRRLGVQRVRGGGAGAGGGRRLLERGGLVDEIVDGDLVEDLVGAGNVVGTAGRLRCGPVEGGVAEAGGRGRRGLEVLVEGRQAGFVLAAQAGEELVPAGDEAGVLLLHLHGLLHRETDEAHRQSRQRLGQLARLVENGGRQTGCRADYLGDLSCHAHTLPHNVTTDTTCGEIHPSGGRVKPHSWDTGAARPPAYHGVHG